MVSVSCTQPLLVSFLLNFIGFCSCERYSLFWNPYLTPKLLSKDGWIQNVMMGDFLDIMCPHTGLTGTVKPNDTAVFDIYRVTKENFKQCRVEEHEKPIFKCDRPDQENKLTLKMQSFSPSPFGFKFSYCTDYYYMGVSRRHLNQTNCKAQTTRFILRVACKETTTLKSKSTTTTIATPTISERPPKVDKDDKSFENPPKHKGRGRHSHPKHVTPNQKTSKEDEKPQTIETPKKTEDEVVENPKEQPYHGLPGDATSCAAPATTLLLLLSITLLWMTSLFSWV